MVTQDHSQPLSLGLLLLSFSVTPSPYIIMLHKHKEEEDRDFISISQLNVPTPGYSEALLIKPWAECLLVCVPPFSSIKDLHKAAYKDVSCFLSLRTCQRQSLEHVGTQTKKPFLVCSEVNQNGILHTTEKNIFDCVVILITSRN